MAERISSSPSFLLPERRRWGGGMWSEMTSRGRIERERRGRGEVKRAWNGGTRGDTLRSKRRD